MSGALNVRWFPTTGFTAHALVIMKMTGKLEGIPA